MNQDIMLSREKYAVLVDRLIAAARASQNAADMFDEKFGQFFGSNRADARCADIIQRYGRLTAGDLAKHAGLTTGAITTMVDRLEKSGVARRIRDKADRRKVFIELTDFSKELGEIVFTPMGEAFGQAMGDVSKDELRIIAEYLEYSERLNRTYARVLEKHISKPPASRAERLIQAKVFASEARDLNTELAKSWGDEPNEASQTGKRPATEMYGKKPR